MSSPFCFRLYLQLISCTMQQTPKQRKRTAQLRTYGEVKSRSTADEPPAMRSRLPGTRAPYTNAARHTHVSKKKQRAWQEFNFILKINEFRKAKSQVEMLEFGFPCGGFPSRRV